MNLYLLTQDVNMGWDTYDSAIVCAESEEEAVKIHPNGEIGVADESIEKGVVLASFNAG